MTILVILLLYCLKCDNMYQISMTILKILNNITNNMSNIVNNMNNKADAIVIIFLPGPSPTRCNCPTQVQSLRPQQRRPPPRPGAPLAAGGPLSLPPRPGLWAVGPTQQARQPQAEPEGRHGQASGRRLPSGLQHGGPRPSRQPRRRAAAGPLF